MAEGKVIQYTVRVNGQDKVIKNTQDWRDAQKEVNEELKRADLGSAERRKLVQESAKLKTINTDLKDEVKKANLELTASGKAAGVAEGSYDALNAELKALELEYKKLGNAADDAERKLDIEQRATTIRKDLRSINERLGRRGLTGAFSEATQGIKNQFNDLGNFIKGGFLVGAVTTLISGLSDAIRQSTQLFNTQAQAESKLLTALKGREDIQQRLIAQAAELQSRTLLGDEQIIDAQAFAVSMGLAEDQVGGVIEAAANLSAVTGQDLQAAIKNIVRTFGGLKGELGELVPQVAALSAEELKAGDAVAVLNEAFGGQAEAAAKVGTGPLTQLKNVFGDILEVVGEFIVNGIDALLPKLQGLADATFSALDFLQRAFSPVVDAAGRLSGAFGDLFGAGTSFGQLVGSLLGGAIRLLATLLSSALNTVSFLVEKFNEARDSTGFFGDAIRATVGFIGDLVRALFSVPRVINGIVSVLQQAGTNFVNFTQRAILSAKILVEELKGVFDQAAADRAEELRKQRADLKAQAKGLGEAFQEGFNEGFDENAGEAVSDAAKVAESAVTTVTNAQRNQASQVELLRARQSELNKEVLEAIVAGKPYGAQLQELQGITRKLTDAQEVLNDALKGEAQAATGSLAGLRARQAALQKELELATDRAEIEAVAQELAVLDAEIAERQRVIDEIRSSASGAAAGSVSDLQSRISAIDARISVTTDQGDLLQLISQRQILEASLDALQSQIDGLKEDADRAGDLSFNALREKDQAYREEIARREEVDAARQEELTEENIRRFEAERDQQILSLLQLEGSRSEIADRIREVEVQAELDILNERLRLAEVGSAEYLAIQRERAEKEVELQQESLDAQRENFEFYLDETLQLVSQVSAAIFQIERDRLEAQAREAEEAVIQEFDARIEANENNVDKVEELEQEKAQKLEAIDKQVAQRQKQIAIKEALINAGVAAIKTLAELGFTPAGLLALTGLAVTTAAEIASIRAQTFAEGGFTGRSILPPDQTGSRPVGIVHENEYVVPDGVLRSKRGRALVGELERMRLSLGYRGSDGSGLFQQGGFTTAEVLEPSGAATVIRTQVVLTEDQVTMIARGVADGAREGSRTGSSEAMDNRNRQIEREARLQQNLEF